MRLLQHPAVQNAVQLAAGLGPVARSGIISPMRPDRLAKVAVDWVRWDFTPGSLLAISAHRYPDRVAVVDDAGEITYAELVESVEALARALAAKGVGERDKIGVLCRNHRAVLQVLGATGRLGGDLVLLNTGLSEGQLADVIAEQDLDVIVADAEFADSIPDDLGDTLVLQAWADVEDAEQAKDRTEHEIARAVPTLAELIQDAPSKDEQKLPRRPRRGRTVVLTSGTTGTPKGAKRPEPSNWMPAASVLSRIPLKAGGVTLVPAPLFHTWGFAGMQLSLALSSTMVLRRRFDPKGLVADLERHRADTVVAVPVMLQRVAELDESERAADTSSLRVVAASGSPIRPALVERILDSWGPVLYNLYGSTEVSWVSIATPEEIREHPTTAGRPPMGTDLAILDDDGNPTPDGEVGRVFVGNGMLFEGYTREGEDKEVVDGMMSTGDLGKIDHGGLLFLSGRSDDMIVSGGENVYPNEVEDLLSGLDGVREAAVVGVDDEDWGTRLAAYVVRTDDTAGQDLDAEAIKSHVKSELAKFSVPRDVHFLPELPRNATGKVVPRQLADAAEEAGEDDVAPPTDADPDEESGSDTGSDETADASSRSGS
ncbi:hypothetical protein GCM10027047_22980 [Rhodococcus aerolatus]